MVEYSQGWRVVSVEPMTLHRTNRLANMYVLSPYVWREGEQFHALVRAVPRRDDEPRLKMSEIWHGVSEDGRDFTMDVAPSIFPGPDLIDLDGCEDPTVHRDGNDLRVWYTGFNQQEETGRLLLARGPDHDRLAKAGLAIDSTPDFANPKESAIAPVEGGGWRMFFEFARDDASLIGQASAAELDGPWTNIIDAGLQPRPDRWDAWHLSPGPIIDVGTDRPVMFYNGATRDATWRIGWVVFDATLQEVVDRSDDPLIEPDDELPNAATDIVFAASAVADGDEVLLYFSQADQYLRVARLARVLAPARADPAFDEE